jgi:hypothetical protein
MKLLVKAISTYSKRERTALRQAQVRLDPDDADALAAAYRKDTTRLRSWRTGSAFIV